MNNRFKELAEQAGAIPINGKPKDRALVGYDNIEKLFELILKDIDGIVDELYQAMPLEQAAVLITLDENIKEHFYRVE